MFPLRDTQKTYKFPLITYAIIAVNAFVFFLEITSANPDAFIEAYALIPSLVNFSRIETLTPFITSQFLHAGFLHIISNMWFLKIFGDNIEERFGSILYLFIYLLAGAVGGLIQYLFSPGSSIPMIGASGAVAGVLGAYLVFFPHHKIETLVPLGLFVTTADLPASLMLGYWFLTQIFSGVGAVAVAQVGGVAFWAHVGGFVFGYLVAKLFQRQGSLKVEEGEILE
jgi:membrane associated rhomboid family serine protease